MRHVQDCARVGSRHNLKKPRHGIFPQDLRMNPRTSVEFCGENGTLALLPTSSGLQRRVAHVSVDVDAAY